MRGSPNLQGGNENEQIMKLGIKKSLLKRILVEGRAFV